MPTTFQFFNGMSNSILNLLTANGGIFVAMGQQEFRWAATIMIAFFGAEAGLFGWSIQETFGRFFNLMILIAFGYLMAVYYVQPIPGWGVSFPHLIIDKTAQLTQQIGYAQAENIVRRLGVFQAGIEIPHWYDLLAVLCYVCAVLLTWTLQALACLEVSYGQVAQAVCYLVGPVFVPFFLIPRLDFLFWSWIRAFLSYSFFQVVSAAIIYVCGNALVLPGPISTWQLVQAIPEIVIVFVTCIYMLLQIPKITNAIMSGSSSGGITASGAAIISRVVA